MSDFLRNIFLWLAIAGTTFFVIQSLSGPATSSSMNYSEFAAGSVAADDLLATSRGPVPGGWLRCVLGGRWLIAFLRWVRLV